VVLGASGHGKVVADIILQAGQWSLAGFVDIRPMAQADFFGLPVLGAQDELPRLAREHDIAALALAVGDNWSRHRALERTKAMVPDLAFPSLVHPGARVARGAVLGEGAVVCAGAVVGPDARVGRFALVNTLAGLDHDSKLGDFASLAPGAVTGGSVDVGAFAAVGIGATVLHGRTVGEHAVVGAHSLVMKDVAPRTVAYGVPARFQRNREPGDPYL
jgi:sugar O-acyltransferase (sialic acid O-acetyltransferase NeuD family)